MGEPTSDVPVFQAKPVEQRKIILKSEQKVLHPNLIPNEILEDSFLNSLIDDSLPKNYNFEIHKTIWKIRQTDSRRVLLQFPEGLIRFGTIIVDIIGNYFSNQVKFIIMGDLTYGACCIDDYLASSMGCDLIVHYAHSCLIPINQLKSGVKYLYIFLDIKFHLEHVLQCIKHNFDPKTNKIALASTIQFVKSTHEVAKKLKEADFSITLPQSRPLSSGEILGCTAPKLSADINTIIFICDGRFHLEALMIANPSVKAYRYDPYSRKLTQETYAFEEMYDQRMSAILKASKVMAKGGTFGFILGTLGRQGSERVYERMIEKLKTQTSCRYVKLMMPEVIQDTLKRFKSVDVWVQIACPRLSIDWGDFFESPLLNPYEFSQCVRHYMDVPKMPGDISKVNYPMDFYAKNSCGNHTPNHSCENNPNCMCET